MPLFGFQVVSEDQTWQLLPCGLLPCRVLLCGPALLFLVLLWWLDALELLDSPESSDNATRASAAGAGFVTVP